MPVTFTTTLPEATLDSVEPDSNNNPVISWTRNDNNPDTLFDVERSSDGGSTWSTIASGLSSSTTSYTDSSTNVGDSFDYRVETYTPHESSLSLSEDFVRTSNTSIFEVNSTTFSSDTAVSSEILSVYSFVEDVDSTITVSGTETVSGTKTARVGDVETLRIIEVGRGVESVSMGRSVLTDLTGSTFLAESASLMSSGATDIFLQGVATETTLTERSITTQYVDLARSVDSGSVGTNSSVVFSDYAISVESPDISSNSDIKTLPDQSYGYENPTVESGTFEDLDSSGYGYESATAEGQTLYVADSFATADSSVLDIFASSDYNVVDYARADDTILSFLTSSFLVLEGDGFAQSEIMASEAQTSMVIPDEYAFLAESADMVVDPLFSPGDVARAFLDSNALWITVDGLTDVVESHLAPETITVDSQTLFTWDSSGQSTESTSMEQIVSPDVDDLSRAIEYGMLLFNDSMSWDATSFAYDTPFVATDSGLDIVMDLGVAVGGGSIGVDVIESMLDSGLATWSTSITPTLSVSSSESGQSVEHGSVLTASDLVWSESGSATTVVDLSVSSTQVWSDVGLSAESSEIVADALTETDEFGSSVESPSFTIDDLLEVAESGLGQGQADLTAESSYSLSTFGRGQGAASAEMYALFDVGEFGSSIETVLVSATSLASATDKPLYVVEDESMVLGVAVPIDASEKVVLPGTRTHLETVSTDIGSGLSSSRGPDVDTNTGINEVATNDGTTDTE